MCLGDYQAEDKLQQIPGCGHTFHLNCIDHWLTTHSTCPLCRLSLISPSKTEPTLEPDDHNQSDSRDDSTETNSRHDNTVEPDDSTETDSRCESCDNTENVDDTLQHNRLQVQVV